jgi:hypothetical protein
VKLAGVPIAVMLKVFDDFADDGVRADRRDLQQMLEEVTGR